MTVVAFFAIFVFFLTRPSTAAGGCDESARHGAGTPA